MSLPKLQYPIFEIEVPSLKLKYKFRPFLVKEEKILLTAQQSGDIKEMVLALKQVINNCCQDTSFDPEALTLFDVEYMFLKLRARSVNNVVEITVVDREDEKEYKLSCNLDDVVMSNDPEHNPVINLNDDLSITLRYPKIEMLDKIQMMQFDISLFFEVIKYCIEEIKYKDEIFDLQNYNEKEIEEFIQQIDVSGFNKITKFFDTMPKMKHVLTYKNSNDKEQKIVLETLADFFILG